MKSKLMTAREAAELWHISVRRVQDLCRQGRVPGAVLFGKTWMIPSDALRPEDGRVRSGEGAAKGLPRRSPLLYMTDLYHTPGCGASASAALHDHPEAQTLFNAGMAYCRGDIETACQYVHSCLENRTGFYAATGAALLLSFCAIWMGDKELWQEARRHVVKAPCRNDADRELLSLVLACMDSAVFDFSRFPSWFERGNFERLPADSHPAAKVFYARFLYAAAYGVASKQYVAPGIEGLGLMRAVPYTLEPLLTQAVVDKTVIAEIHLRLWCATVYHNAGQDDMAIPHIDRAIALALPDRLFGVLAEHCRPLDSLLDERLALQDPSGAKTMTELFRRYFAGEARLRNELFERRISLHLTAREREIAKMAAFGLTNKAIAKSLGIGESTVKSTVQSIMQKTGLSSRDDFALIL